MRRSIGSMILLTVWGFLVAPCAAPLVVGPPPLGPDRPVSLTLPQGWSSLTPPGARAVEVSKSWTVAGEAIRGHVVVATEQRLSHDEAVQRLTEIAAEMAAPPRYAVIGGWPAL